MNEASDLPPSVTPGIGARLRDARESRGLTYDAVAAELRIRPVILAAMEREDHAALPERVYLLGLLRTYARHLGLDPAAVSAAWGVRVLREHRRIPRLLSGEQGERAVRH